MSNMCKKIKKTVIETNPYLLIKKMQDYLKKHNTYEEVIKQLHIDYITSLYILKYKGELSKYRTYGELLTKDLKEIYYNATKNKDKVMNKLAYTKSLVDKSAKIKKERFINPISSNKSNDKYYGYMTLAYIIGLWWMQKNDIKEYANTVENLSLNDLESLEEKIYAEFYKDIVQRIGTNDLDNKLSLLVDSFNSKFMAYTNILSFTDLYKHKDIRFSDYTIKFFYILIAYLYGVNSSFLIGESNHPQLFVDVTGESFQKEHLRMKLLYLYENGYITDLYKTDGEIDKLFDVLIDAPVQRNNPTYESLQYFCTKYEFDKDAMTGKYKQIREDIPLVPTIEFKGLLKYFNNYITNW